MDIGIALLWISWLLAAFVLGACVGLQFPIKKAPAPNLPDYVELRRYLGNTAFQLRHACAELDKLDPPPTREGDQ